MASTFEKGDHLRVNRGPYDHEGIYVGEGRVVHYSEPRPNAGKREAIIQETSIEVFANGGQVHSDPSTPTRYTPEQLAQRARSRIGESAYDLLRNNCEHFAAWVRTGRSISNQVEGAMLVGGAALALSVHRYGSEKVMQGVVQAFGVVLGISALDALMRSMSR